MSVWHRALAITFTRTSPALGGWTLIVSIFSGSLGAHATAAWHVMISPSASGAVAGATAAAAASASAIALRTMRSACQFTCSSMKLAMKKYEWSNPSCRRRLSFWPLCAAAASRASGRSWSTSPVRNWSSSPWSTRMSSNAPAAAPEASRRLASCFCHAASSAPR